MSHWHTSSAPPLDASGVFAWRLLDFLTSRRPSAQEELGNKRLDKARDLAMSNEAMISPHDMAIAKEKFTLWVISPQSILKSPSQCSTHLSSTEIRAGLGSRRGLSRFIQAREYGKATKDALRFVEVIHNHTSHRQQLFLTISWSSRPSPPEFKMKGSGNGLWA
jgi:hypothetical protein